VVQKPALWDVGFFIYPPQIQYAQVLEEVSLAVKMVVNLLNVV